MRSIVTSIFLYACESWTLKAELQRRLRAMEMRCYRKISRISYKDHITNEKVRVKIQHAIGPRPDHRKETQTGVVWTCLPFIGSGQNHLAKHIERRTRQGRQGKRWEDNIREWTGLKFAKSQRAVENRDKWRKLVVTSSGVP